VSSAPVLAGHWRACHVGATTVVTGVAVLRAALVACNPVRCRRQWAICHGRALPLLFSMHLRSDHHSFKHPMLQASSLHESAQQRLVVAPNGSLRHRAGALGMAM
jgi:hypothetical protein